MWGVLAFLLGHAAPARAGTWEITFLAGAVFPTYDERLTIRVPTLPSAPGLDVSSSGDLLLSANGGTVFTGAVSFGSKIVAFEGRVDAAGIGLDTNGVRYAITYTPATGGTASATLTIPEGTIEFDRVVIYSANLKVRTPGAVSFIASGGISYLPNLQTSTTLPLVLDVTGVPGVTGASGALGLVAEPGQSSSRFGANVGAGLGVHLGGPVSIQTEVRAFAFKSYNLRFDVRDGGDLAGFAGLVEGLGPVKFNPVLLNASAGIVLSF